MAKQYWLLKTDAESYSIEDLQRDGTTAWTGVRNYQARNYMRDDMKAGDMGFFYHSSTDVPGIVGVVEIASSAFPDDTAFDPKDSHFDPKATTENPIWCAVEIKYLKHMKETIPLEKLRSMKGLENMKLLQKGSRLSITPVTEKEWKIIEKAA